MGDDGYIPGPKVKIINIQWYKESLFGVLNVNNPLR